MTDLFFWKTWRARDQFLFGLIAMVSVVAMGLCLISLIRSPEPAIVWEVVSKLDSIPIPLYTINLGLLDVDFKVDNYLITQYFQGSGVNIYASLGLVYCCFLSFGLAVSLAVVTSLSRFWFILGMVGFIFLMMNFNLEQLLLFGRTDQIGLGLAFVLYLPLSYYLHAFRSDIGYPIRLVIFLALTLVFGLIIHFGSEVDHPFLYLANYGLFAPVIISMIFVVTVSHEIVFGFLYITTAGSKSRKNLFHFLVITGFYLVNLLLLYLFNRQKIDWDLIYFNEFLLLMVSAFLGLWGLKKREHLTGSILAFQPQGAYLYLAAMVVCFSTIGYLFVNANDPLVETFEDGIVFSLIGFGVIAVIYVFANFFNLIYYDLPIHKVVYKPSNMPFWVARLGSLLFVLGLVALSDFVPLNQALAGYYNGIGDLYALKNQQLLADGYYENASYYGFQNHRSNYSLAQTAFERGDRPRGFRFLSESIEKNPSPHAYANLARYYDQNDQFFDALFTLNDGLEAFPDHPALLTNMGLLYGKSTVVDSLFFYLRQAMTHRKSSRQARTNLLAKLLEKNIAVAVDSAESGEWVQDYLPLRANYLALANSSGQELAMPLPPGLLSDSILDFEEFSLLNNYLINRSERMDSSTRRTVNVLSTHPANRWCEEGLTLALALAQKRSGNLTEAFARVNELKSSSRNIGYYQGSLGLWAMEERDFQRAASYFDIAATYGFRGAEFYRALALLFGGLNDEARQAISTLDTASAVNQDYLAKIKHSLDIGQEDILAEEDDELKYFWILANNSQSSELTYRIWKSTGDPISTQVALEMAHQSMDRRDWDEARKWLENLNASDSTHGQTESISWAHTRYCLSIGADDELSSSVQKLSPKRANRRLLVKLLEARRCVERGELQLAAMQYRSLGRSNPYLYQLVLEAAAFYNKTMADPDEAYDLLLQALQFNQNSIPIRKEYALQCLRMGLTNYAELSKSELRSQMDSEEFVIFELIYKQVEKEAEEALQWGDGPA